jgi:hypothetical protein
MTSTLQDAIGTVRTGDYEKAQQQLAEVIAANPDEVQAWYLLSQIVDSDARRAAYLSKTLALDPYHQRAWAEFFSLPTEVVDRLEPGQAPTAVTVNDFSPPPPPAPTATAAVTVDVETALPDWLRPVAKDQPVVAQRRPAPVSPAPPPVAAPVSPSAEPPATAEGNRTLSVLLAILLIATLVVLGFLVYLLLQG